LIREDQKRRSKERLDALLLTDPVTQRQRLDLLEKFVYFGEQAGVDVAERYFSALDATCVLLVKQPIRNAAVSSAGIRQLPVSGGGGWY
jgi:hypothetical protein